MKRILVQVLYADRWYFDLNTSMAPLNKLMTSLQSPIFQSGAMLLEGLPSYLPGYHVNTTAMPGFRLEGNSLYSNIAGRLWHLSY